MTGLHARHHSLQLNWRVSDLTDAFDQWRASVADLGALDPGSSRWQRALQREQHCCLVYLQLAEAARARVSGQPVLFISGYAGTSLPPGIDMIDKPFELDVLVRRVQAALEADRQRRHRDDRA